MALLPAQLQNFSLAGSGVSISDITMTLSSFQTIDGVDLAMSDFGSIGYMTIEPGSRDREEQISFTGVTQNASGTATLTGIKTVLFLSPYTQTSGFAKSHPGGVVAVVTNTSGYYNEFGIKENNETLTGFWQAPDPLATQGIATKNYVDNLVNGGTVTTNALIEVGVAGETISSGNVVYLKAADGRWWKALGGTAATVNVIQLGIAQGAGTAAANITGGVLRRGVDTHQSGGAAGSIGYVSNTSTVATTAGTVERAIGNFLSTTTFDFDPDFYYTPTANIKAASAGTSGTAPASTNLFIDERDLTGSLVSYSGRTIPTGWLSADGSAVSRTTYSALFAKLFPSNTFTVTIASPGVFSATAHGYSIGDAVSFTTTGALPTGLAVGTIYYIISAGFTANAFEVSATQGGSVVNTSGTQSGVHTVYLSNYGIGDGTTTFNVPFVPKELQTNTTGQAVFDTYSRSVTNTSTTHTWSHTCTGENRLLVVSVTGTDGTSTVTYNAVSMTKVDEQVTGGGSYHSQWYLVAPSLGTNSIIATSGSSVAAQGSALSFTGIRQASPLDTSSKSTATAAVMTGSLTTTVANDLLILSDVAASNALVSPPGGWEKIGTASGSAQVDMFYYNHTLPVGLSGGTFNLSASVEFGRVLGAYFAFNPVTQNTAYQIIKT